MNILYEDNHLFIINKAVGQIVQGDKTNDISLIDEIKQYLKTKHNKPGNVFVGLPHRLDRPTSGVVIFTKTDKALTRFNEMFKQSEVKKLYWAVVNAQPPKNQDVLTHYLTRNAKQNKSYAYDTAIKESKIAVLEYKQIAKSDHYYLLEIDLKTGRHHQIRCQLAKIGCYIKGDLKYGASRSNPNGGIHLHARSAEFIHPVTKQLLTVTAPTPDDSLWNAFNAMLTS